MRILVTGASGFIGLRLCHRLAESGYGVDALYRNQLRLEGLEHRNVVPLQCDITSFQHVRQAINGCDYCFHLAALAKAWSSDPAEFDRVNVDGTRNVLLAALESGVRRVVFTSTAAVFGSADPASPINESRPLAKHLDSEYERTKKACESVVEEFQSQGLDVVTVYPTRVFGPGVLNESNVLTDIFRRFNRGKWRFVPGNGKAIGNYVFVDDVVTAHTLAMFKSAINERYLIGGENLSFNQLVAYLRSSTGKMQRLFHVHKSVLLMYANWQMLRSHITGRPPMITPAFVVKYLNNSLIDCSKAKSELGYEPRSFAEGLETTLQWIRENGI